MKRAFANWLLNLATAMGAKRVTVQVIKDGFSEAAAEAILNPNKWSEDDSKELAKFLATPAGANLLKRLQVVAATVAIKGSMNQTATVWAAGNSAGWNEAVRYLASLSRVSREPETPADIDSNRPGETDYAELLSP